jgi:hypothetical protein
MQQVIELSGSAVDGVMPQAFRSIGIQSMPTHVCLGMNEPLKPVDVPHFDDFYNYGAVDYGAAPPDTLNRREKAARSLSRMYLNDRMGCCVIAGKAHNLGLWSANDSDSGGEVQATDQEIESQYHSICGPGDNGCMIDRVLNVMASTGFRAGNKLYKIDGYVAVDWTKKDAVKTVQYLFGASTVGFNLPEEWTKAAVWAPTNSRLLGGHDVSPIDYDDRGIYVSSWGRVYLWLWEAFLSTRWVSQYFAMLAPLWYGNDQMSPCGVDVQGLKTAMDIFKRGIVPPIPDEKPPIEPPIDPPVGGSLYQLTTDAAGKLLFTPQATKLVHTVVVSEPPPVLTPVDPTPVNWGKHWDTVRGPLKEIVNQPAA